MVIDFCAVPGWGALALAANFMQETLRSSVRGRPWVVVERPDQRQLFVAGMPQELRLAVMKEQLLWVRVEDAKLIPEIVQLLLQSSLCEGIFLRGLEDRDMERPQLWMRRWQLECERVGTHLFRVHEQPSDLVGVKLKVQWHSESEVELLRGWSLLRKDSRENSYQSVQTVLRKALHKTKIDESAFAFADVELTNADLKNTMKIEKGASYGQVPDQQTA